MSTWGWQPEPSQGLWNCGPQWLRPLVAAVPWITVGLLLVMLGFIGGTLTSTKGVLFDLPEAGLEDGEATGLVALVMPTDRGTLVFFDDARYVLGDEASDRELAVQISSRVEASGDKTLLVLADRRVAGGELMNLAAIVRHSGIEKLLFAEKTAETVE